MNVMQRARRHKTGRVFFALFLFITFFIAQVSQIPAAYSLPTPLPVSLPAQVSGSNFQAFGDLYVFTNPEDSNFLMVAERLPEGGFGRLLRYRGEIAGGLVDREMIYEDQTDQITILDYRTGRFYRTTFTGERPDPPSAFPSQKNLASFDPLAIPQGASIKSLLPKANGMEKTPPFMDRLHSDFKNRFEEKNWLRRLVRGPPAGEALP